MFCCFYGGERSAIHGSGIVALQRRWFVIADFREFSTTQGNSSMEGWILCCILLIHKNSEEAQYLPMRSGTCARGEIDSVDYKRRYGGVCIVKMSSPGRTLWHFENQ